MNSLTTLGAKTILLAIRDNPESAIDTLELKVKLNVTHYTWTFKHNNISLEVFVHYEIVFDLHITMKFGQTNEKNAI